MNLHYFKTIALTSLFSFSAMASPLKSPLKVTFSDMNHQYSVETGRTLSLQDRIKNSLPLYLPVNGRGTDACNLAGAAALTLIFFPFANPAYCDWRLAEAAVVGVRFSAKNAATLDLIVAGYIKPKSSAPVVVSIKFSSQDKASAAKQNIESGVFKQFVLPFDSKEQEVVVFESGDRALGQALVKTEFSSTEVAFTSIKQK